MNGVGASAAAGCAAVTGSRKRDVAGVKGAGPKTAGAFIGATRYGADPFAHAGASNTGPPAGAAVFIAAPDGTFGGALKLEDAHIMGLYPGQAVLLQTLPWQAHIVAL